MEGEVKKDEEPAIAAEEHAAANAELSKKWGGGYRALPSGPRLYLPTYL